MPPFSPVSLSVGSGVLYAGELSVGRLWLEPVCVQLGSVVVEGAAVVSAAECYTDPVDQVVTFVMQKLPWK